ncbi:hypothetical protein [Brevundimonas naejangsanensis]
MVGHIDHVVRVGCIDCAGFGSNQPAMGDDRDEATKVANLADYQRRNLGRAGVEPLADHVTGADMDSPHPMAVLDAALRQRGLWRRGPGEDPGREFAGCWRRR